jgi:hypothetical protein
VLFISTRSRAQEAIANQLPQVGWEVKYGRICQASWHFASRKVKWQINQRDGGLL